MAARVEVVEATIGGGATAESRQPYEMLKAAVRAVLTDDGFSVSSKPAQSARVTASRVLQWCDDPCNLPRLTAFSQELLQLLQECLSMQQLPHQVKRERMWEAYHKLHTSDVFKTKWVDFLKVFAPIGPCPIFYQYVTDRVFKDMVLEHFQVNAETGNRAYTEVNALRYSAGYVPRALRKKLERGSHPLKEELILCLYEMTEEDVDKDRSESEDWVTLVDRGGLKHVNSAVFMLFTAMEICVHKRICSTSQPMFDHLREEILTDKDVLFHWAIVSANWDEEESTPLLPMIVQLWVTIRGFAYASGWMENYTCTSRPTRNQYRRQEEFANTLCEPFA